ncbi:MAG: hypothetical protein QF704_14740, partial [Anaerolineales bacterium]|nr:hypothetical protein [Anaerolineales bacterium]
MALKPFLKKIVPSFILRILEDYRTIFQRLDTHERRLVNLTGTILAPRYSSVAAPLHKQDQLNTHGFKCFSQNNEDG